MKRKWKKRNGRALFVSALSCAALLAGGCSTANVKTAPNEENRGQKQQESLEQNRKNTQKETKNSTTGAAEEEKNDDLELSGLQQASGSAIDLSKLSASIKISQGGTYTLSGKTTHSVVIDATGQDVTLVLDQADIHAKDLPAIYVRQAKSLQLEVKGDSSLASDSHTQADALNAALYVCSPLSLKGSGKLSITDGTGHAIKGKEDMNIGQVNLNLTSEKDGIHASDALSVTGGTFTLKAGDEGMEVNEKLHIAGGVFTIDSKGDGLRAEKELEITNGTFTITSENEGLESKGTLLIKNGTYTLHTADDGINAATSLTIQNGTFDIVSSGNDAIDSNGDLNLEGGTIYATALSPAEGAFDTDNTPFVISAGTIAAISNTASLPTQCDQNTVLITAPKAFSKVELRQDGKTLLSWSPKEALKSGGVLTLSCKDLKAGQQAEVYVDGTLLDSAFEVKEGLTQVGTIRQMGGGPRQGWNENGAMENGERPQGMPEGQRPEGERPEEFFEGERPEGMPPERFQNEQSDADGRKMNGKGQKRNRSNSHDEKTDTETGSTPENGQNDASQNRRSASSSRPESEAL